MMNTQILGRLSPLLRSHSPLSSVFYTRTSLRFSRSLYPTHLTSNPLADPLCPSPSNPSIWIFYSPFTHTPSFRRYEDECNRDPDSPPKLFVVQPRVRPEKILQAKLNEALNLANSLEVQRDGYFKTEFSEKKLPPHVVVHDPLSRSRKGRADKYFGPGTVENIKCHINALETDDKLDAVFVNAVLTGTQQRNLERAWDKPVLDRIGLIIMIFNAHAYTKEAKLQAELAALMYQKTRLVRIRGPDGRYTFGALGEAEVVSARGRGGSMGRGFLSGAGETELELQRRRISERRLRLLAEIDEVRRTRALQRNARKRRGGLDGQELPTVAIVGYTNAGKSTLVSVLSDSDLYSDDRLFATVDPRLRSVTLPSGKIVLLSDTVGFISDLPVQLVEAFHATLEEVVEAELLVHVVDSSAPNLDEQRCAVLQVLKQIGVSEEKIQNMIEVWNKIDIQDDQDSDEYLYNGEDTEAENFSHVEDDTASELSLGKHGGGSISRVEDDDMASELSPRESEEGNNRNSNGRWLGDEEIEDQQSDYSDGWLAPGDSEVCSEDWVYSSMGWAFDEQTQEPFSELMSGKDSDSQSKPTPPVKTSAITGVGLQELLELIDEKIGAIVENRDSNRKVERFEFDRKWRPPRPRDAAMVVEK
ncbi:hypothetical protein Nepgr_027034 [Nepenthes gracilis]|uniref:Hflx-type G domain-containing protein n=1 Tax=Nepenthes gracilis TaxID=150966 RepID=A0AAD3TAV0_NEPGR|nr:hypothetical protein Nepgr_027034 [Nepenthes gracilis]